MWIGYVEVKVFYFRFTLILEGLLIFALCFLSYLTLKMSKAYLFMNKSECSGPVVKFSPQGAELA